MSERRIYLDECVGEARGVVTLDGAPERLLIRREGDDPRLLLGARLAAVTASVEPQLSTAFLDAGGGAQVILPFKPGARPARGQVLEVEVRAEPRRGKLAIVRLVGEAEGPPRLLSPPPDLSSVLAGFARAAALVVGREAREIADLAEAEALETIHALPGGGRLSIEPTRALTAVDVDLGERKGADAKRVTRAANLAAIGLCARLLRLKGVGGLVVMDLAGRGHEPATLLAAARAAFAPDNPGVALGSVGRFGTLEISLPRRTRPLSEVLLDEAGALTDRSLAQRLVRRLAAEAEADPGARLAAVCVPSVAAVAEPMVGRLAERFGARLVLREDSERRRESFDVARS